MLSAIGYNRSAPEMRLLSRARPRPPPDPDQTDLPPERAGQDFLVIEGAADMPGPHSDNEESRRHFLSARPNSGNPQPSACRLRY